MKSTRISIDPSVGPATWLPTLALLTPFVMSLVMVINAYTDNRLSWFGVDQLSWVTLVVFVVVALLEMHRSNRSWLQAALIFSFLGAWLIVDVIDASHKGDPGFTGDPTIPVILAALLLAPGNWNSYVRAGDIALTYVVTMSLVLFPLSLWTTALDHDTFWNPLVGQHFMSTLYSNWPFSGRYGAWFGHPNLLAPLAIVATVYGVYRGKLLGTYLAVAGIALVFLSGSKGFVAALLAAMLAAILGRIWPWIRSRALRLGLVLASLLVTALFTWLFFSKNPELTGRTSLWTVYLEQFKTSPIFGVGTGKLFYLYLNGDTWGFHGHNLIIEPMTRFGLVGLFTVMVALGFIVVATIRGMRRHFSFGFAILVMVLIGGIVEPILIWTRFVPMFAILLWAYLFTVVATTRQPVLNHASSGAIPGGLQEDAASKSRVAISDG